MWQWQTHQTTWCGFQLDLFQCKGALWYWITRNITKYTLNWALKWITKIHNTNTTGHYWVPSLHTCTCRDNIPSQVIMVDDFTRIRFSLRRCSFWSYMYTQDKRTETLASFPRPCVKERIIGFLTAPSYCSSLTLSKTTDPSGSNSIWVATSLPCWKIITPYIIIYIVIM